MLPQENSIAGCVIVIRYPFASKPHVAKICALSATAADIATARFLQRPPVTAASCNGRVQQRPPALCNGRSLSRSRFAVRFLQRPPPLPPPVTSVFPRSHSTAPVGPRAAACLVLRPAFDIELPHRSPLIALAWQPRFMLV
jgi:hypothetical protein